MAAAIVGVLQYLAESMRLRVYELGGPPVFVEVDAAAATVEPGPEPATYRVTIADDEAHNEQSSEMSFWKVVQGPLTATGFSAPERAPAPAELCAFGSVQRVQSLFPGDLCPWVDPAGAWGPKGGD
jgi:hypothetical protein